ncbi:glycerate kinase type-2 family protein [[Eubacterium] cellulosolvens]
MIIKNKKELATSTQRKNLLEIIESGIEAVLPENLMRAKVKYNPEFEDLIINNEHFNLKSKRFFVIGGGKAAGTMGEALEKIIPPDKITAGILNCNSIDYKTTQIQLHEAGHPIPDERSVVGVKKMLEIRNDFSINKSDIILCLLSGGGSALLPYPVREITLEDKQKTVELLLYIGANIQELNVVRKHISKTKGGRLGKFFEPATVISIIISDVIGNDLSSIASGPTSTDDSRFQDAYNILKEYEILDKAPESVVNYISNNIGDNTNETIRDLDNCYNFIIGDNRDALEAMAEKARLLDLKPLIVTSEQTGDPNTVAQERANEILVGKYSGSNVVLLGGETTPMLPKRAGTGGRNQHLATASMVELKNYSGNWAMASVASDGADFIPGIAGAVVDNSSLSRVNDLNLDIAAYLDNFDSNTLLNSIGDSLILTGNTGTNVGDLIIYILGG